MEEAAFFVATFSSQEAGGICVRQTVVRAPKYTAVNKQVNKRGKRCGAERAPLPGCTARPPPHLLLRNLLLLGDAAITATQAGFVFRRG